MCACAWRGRRRGRRRGRQARLRHDIDDRGAREVVHAGDKGSERVTGDLDDRGGRRYRRRALILVVVDDDSVIPRRQRGCLNGVDGENRTAGPAYSQSGTANTKCASCCAAGSRACRRQRRECLHGRLKGLHRQGRNGRRGRLKGLHRHVRSAVLVVATRALGGSGVAAAAPSSTEAAKVAHCVMARGRRSSVGMYLQAIFLPTCCSFDLPPFLSSCL